MADIRFHYFSVAVRNLEEGMKRYEQYFGLRPVGGSVAAMLAMMIEPCGTTAR